jgi:hypothetical protein
MSDDQVDPVEQHTLALQADTLALQADAPDPKAVLAVVAMVRKNILTLQEEGWGPSEDELEGEELEAALAAWGDMVAALVRYAGRLGVDLTVLAALTAEEQVLIRRMKPLYPDPRGMPYYCRWTQDDAEWKRLAAQSLRALGEFEFRLKLPAGASGPTPAPANPPQEPEEPPFQPKVKEVPELELCLYPDDRRARRVDQEVKFRGKGVAWDIFCNLCRRYPSRFSGRDLIGAVWPKGFGDENALAVHTSTLRKLLAPLGLTVDCVPNSGYVLQVLPDDHPADHLSQP